MKKIFYDLFEIFNHHTNNQSQMDHLSNKSQNLCFFSIFKDIRQISITQQHYPIKLQIQQCFIYKNICSSYKTHSQQFITNNSLQIIIFMDYYGLFTLLVGARGGNLPPYKDARLRRYKSVQKIMDLIITATKLSPGFPVRAITLDPFDPEWDDIMPFPTIDYTNYALYGLGLLANFWMYAYNYNTLTGNIRFRNIRYFFPFVNAILIGRVFYKYNNNLLRVNLFDEYNWLRAQQLVQQNQYLFKHEDFKKFIWWCQDLKQTLNRVHRQANDHESTDFKDSQIILQDFIDRYVDPKAKHPLESFKSVPY